MIYLALPTGNLHGWGICGKYIARNLAELTRGQVRLITDAMSPDSVGDELDFLALAALIPRQEELRNTRVINGESRLDGPLLGAIVDKQMLPIARNFRGTRTVGYTFFEENILQPEWIANARRYFDAVATGSSWCSEVLRNHGLDHVSTVIQGIDPRIFFPRPEESEGGGGGREFLRDRFVIFSGGKFELRKGQDIVIRAVKIMQDRHRDVFLINAWNNPWPESIQTMNASKHITLPNASGPYVQVMRQILAHNDLDLGRILTLGPRANALMPRIYRNTDVGLFPNRCEGGTNLVLMEYIACGKPVIATASTGHADVVFSEHALVIPTRGQISIMGRNGATLAQWPEPDLDQTVERLEFAYRNRDEMRRLGGNAAAFMAGKTWGHSAGEFLKLL